MALTKETQKARENKSNISKMSREDRGGWRPWAAQVHGAISGAMEWELPAGYEGPSGRAASAMEVVRLTSVPGASRVQLERPAKNFDGLFIAHGHCDLCAREVYYPALDVCERCGVAVWCSDSCRAAGADAHAAACSDCRAGFVQCRREYRDGSGSVTYDELRDVIHKKVRRR